MSSRIARRSAASLGVNLGAGHHGLPFIRWLPGHPTFIAPVNDYFDAGDVRALLGGQEQGDVRDLLRRPRRPRSAAQRARGVRGQARATRTLRFRRRLCERAAATRRPFWRSTRTRRRLPRHDLLWLSSHTLGARASLRRSRESPRSPRIVLHPKGRHVRDRVGSIEGQSAVRLPSLGRELRALAEAALLGRLGRPQEVANVALSGLRGELLRHRHRK